jgi:hypothetical protein
MILGESPMAKVIVNFRIPKDEPPIDSVEIVCGSEEQVGFKVQRSTDGYLVGRDRVWAENDADSRWSGGRIMDSRSLREFAQHLLTLVDQFEGEAKC